MASQGFGRIWVNNHLFLGPLTQKNIREQGRKSEISKGSMEHGMAPPWEALIRAHGKQFLEYVLL